MGEGKEQEDPTVRIWKKTLKLAVSPLGVSMVLVMVGIWVRDWRWALTGVALMGFFTWAVALMVNTEGVKAEREDEDNGGQ